MDGRHHERRAVMQQVNLEFVLRNDVLAQAIEAADGGDGSIVHALLEMVRDPSQKILPAPQHDLEMPDWLRQKIGCSMLSCSS